VHDDCHVPLGMGGAVSRTTPLARADRAFTQDEIDEFGRISGGNGRIHTDPAYAAASPFGRTLVQGVLLLAVVERAVCSAVPSWARAGEIEAVFLGPVGAGETFHVEVFEDHAPGVLRIEGTTEHGTVLAGTARVGRSGHQDHG
jgi:acyl dehydratase